MSSYTDFAYLYDRLIDQDYEKWADYLEECFEKYAGGITHVLDLACGTGNITTLLAKRGYDMIGIDSSTDMLSVAASKSEGLPIQYVCQDMSAFELYGNVDAVICTLDCINYLTKNRDVLKTFRLVEKYLYPNGLFIFDINSQYKIENILGNQCYITDLDDVFYTWENFYNEESRICSYNLTFFVKNGEKYNRVDEYQEQKAYLQDEIEDLIKKAGLSLLGCFDGLSFNKSSEKSERLMFVCKKKC
ncbi:MAG: class I SAM-dependent methyltransferase [Eubacteriales bacterium]|jgi:SAM-dependent methyltransferase|nr:class I SAM-dependent methyltransferase [Eubacteriales bacterium]